MWQVENHTPYAAERNWIRDEHGAHHWIVAVKATFLVDARGTLTLADEQPPPLFAPEHNGEDGVSSVRHDTDLGPLKPATDVWVVGHACAPGDKPVAELPIALRFGPVHKNLLVRGENVFYSGVGGLTTTSPLPFVRMPVTYERAYGGADTSAADPSRHRIYAKNPVGVGFSLGTAQLERTPGPNVVYPGQDLAKAGPAGFGAIASHWSPRAELAGTYDAKWVQERRPLLPADYDARFVLCAPLDQRVPGYLAAGARVELVHMTPDEVMRFEVPALRLGFRTCFGSRTREHPGVLASIVLEPDERRVRLVWQTSLAVPPTQIDHLDQTIVEEVKG